MAEKRTEISELGEFGLIEHLTSSFQTLQPSTVLGVGDDAAIVKQTDNQVITSDMLIEGVHFDLSYMPLKHLGFKAIAVNISDIAAMNAIPSQVVVNIGLSNRFSVEAVTELYEGIRLACDAYQVDLIGGDTNASRSGLIISVTAIGFATESEIVKRSGAGESDILCVTGDLGASYLGLQVLEREKQVYMSNPDMQPKLEGYDYLMQRQLRPEARMDIIHELRGLQIVPTSMIDISDGLASEVFHLGSQSGVGFRVYEDKLPIDKVTYDTAYEFKIDATTCALNGGEDYELLFTISQSDFEKIKDHADIHLIGHAQKASAGFELATKGGNLVPIQAQGWNHMKKDN
ncbi:thiamine-phosphate kinase [Fulvivirga sedimenti]|uniref:Thiamine-monophosphate kinase n=1 Tax=Fulvivirga sedimenti TaxID=2879465 RepID=A0A9X1HVQ1_9BACT|nr:thiamine-phosphate kinase [Fulvivirga sedimenti]MCA6077918.1 thiamine-phosphate kinase [Fulvivirga sedimenti]